MSRRRLLIFIPLTLGLGAAGYAVLWWIAADRIAAGLDRWAEARRGEGWTVSYDAPSAGGFPAWIAFDIGRPAIEAPVRDGTARWTAATVTLRARPWRWRRIAFAASGRHEMRHLHLASRRVFRGWADGAEGTIRLAEDGAMRGVEVRLSAVGLRPGDGTGEIRIGRVAAVLTASRGDGAPHTLDARLVSVVLPADTNAPLGRTIERIGLSATLSRPVPPGPLGRALAAWRDAGGGLRLDDVTIRWGPLNLTGEGSFVLDGALQPRGRMTVNAEGYNETMDALAHAGRLRPRDLMGARIVLGLLARPGPNGAMRVTLPLAIADRFVSAGPQQLGRLPRILWE